ncbi:MAG TPA: hypothetical protein VFG44_08570 [Burkholderiales bacterium]|nr:hypothetical protein [Burkholderiales bacterium]
MLDVDLLMAVAGCSRLRRANRFLRLLRHPVDIHRAPPSSCQWQRRFTPICQSKIQNRKFAVLRSISLPFVFTLERAQTVEQIEHHRNARQVDAEIVAQPSDQAQPRHRGGVEKQARPFSRARLDQAAFDETLDQRGVHIGARGQRFEAQMIFHPAENQLVSV